MSTKSSNRFFTTKEVGSGTRLRLSTVHGIINQTGGHIFIDSELGKGACFTIDLPQNDSVAMTETGKSEPVDAQPAEPAPASDLTGFGTIMQVEDAVRMFGARALRNKRYTVVEALTPLETNADTIDVLITDVGYARPRWAVDDPQGTGIPPRNEGGVYLRLY